MKIYMLNNLNIKDDDGPIKITNQDLINDLVSDEIGGKNVYIVSSDNNHEELEYLYKTSFMLSGINVNEVFILSSLLDTTTLENEGILIIQNEQTLKQMEYIEKEGLLDFIKNFNGVILAIGNAIKNLPSCAMDENEKEICHDGLGIDNILVEPNYDEIDEHDMRYGYVLSLSIIEKVYGLTKDSYIIKDNNNYIFKGNIKQIRDTIEKNIESGVKKYI